MKTMSAYDQKASDAGCDGYVTRLIDRRKPPKQVADLLAKERS